jgi:transcriptional regulator with XRE-family HTH domain
VNGIKEWLDSKLRERKLSVESFARLCGITRAAIYFYRSDENRPNEATMRRMCLVLGVPIEEGLAQYMPKIGGRPKRVCSTLKRFETAPPGNIEATPKRGATDVKTEETTTPRLAEMVSERMEQLGITIDKLAKAVDISYEHARRIVRGMCVPSRFVLKAICEELNLPYKQLLDNANADRITEKYGDLPTLMAGKKPSLEPLERVWDDLTEDQQQDLIVIGQGWAMRTRARKTRLEHQPDAEGAQRP